MSVLHIDVHVFLQEGSADIPLQRADRATAFAVNPPNTEMTERLGVVVCNEELRDFTKRGEVFQVLRRRTILDVGIDISQTCPKRSLPFVTRVQLIDNPRVE